MKFKKILSFFLAVLFCFSLLIPSAFAAESSLEQELKNVIDFSDYPANSKDTGVYLITLMEDGYNGTGYDSSSGIYVYLYNPSKKAFKSSTDLNKMTFAKNLQSDGSPCDFEKYSLTLIESAKDGVLIKAKVEAAASELVIKSSGVRHYAVSEIELFEDGHYNTNAQAYKCGYDFAFTGSGEDLKCERTSFLTIELDVKSTSYITGDSLKGKNYSNVISSVYFSVPKAIEAKYGKLYLIDYETYKYYTSPMILLDKDVENFDSLYSLLLACRGYSPEKSYFKFRFGDASFLDGYMYHQYDYGFGYKDDVFYTEPVVTKIEYVNELSRYTTVFPVDTLEPNTLVVSSDEVLEYFATYYASYATGMVRDKYSADLFQSAEGEHIRETRNRNEWETLPSYHEGNGWFGGIRDYGIGYLWNKDKHDDTINAKMIESIDSSDFGSSNFCEDYLVSEMDVDDLKSYVSNATVRGQNTYLFRFAFDDDYYAAEGELSRLLSLSGEVKETIAINGVVTPVYLDFDIIELGFSDDGVTITTFGVSSSPIDAFVDLSTSDKNTDGLPDPPDIDWTWLKLLIAAFVGLFALYVIINIVNWFTPSKKKTEEKPQQTSPPKRYYSKPKRRRSRTSYRRGRRR